MRRTRGVLTPPELEVMRIVWAKGEATVRDVYEALLERRRIAYTTVMTVLRVLETKGYVKRQPAGRAFVYRPTKPEAVVVKSMVREFVGRVFGGAAQPLLLHLVEDRKLTSDELDELARRVRESE
jgi:predicted transcriptional regulator